MSDVGRSKTELDTPVLWVDLDNLENNIQQLAKHFKQAGVDWRPHTKGIKIPAIAHKMMNAGAIGVTCAKLGEAEVMAAAGITDILIANQVVGPTKIRRLIQLRHSADVKVAVDSEVNVDELGQAAQASGVEIGVLVDVNTGMNRTGVAPGPDAVQLAQRVHDTPGMVFLGLMAWEGHTLSHTDPDTKRVEIQKTLKLLENTKQQCEEIGIPVSIVSGGGSGTYLVTPFDPVMTEIQAGGAIFNDVAYDGWGVNTTQCLFIKTLVTSRPALDRVIFDAGFKTMPTAVAQPRPIGIDGIAAYYASAEHGVMTLEASNTIIKVGDMVDFVVGYTDATLFLHDRLYGIRNDTVEVVWDVLGRGKLQ